jgi:phosphoglycolate phosphatase
MGIIFDLDGTLLDTMEDIARATNFALFENGYPTHDKTKYTRMVGHGLKDLVSKALPENADENELNKVYKTLIMEYTTNPVQDTVAYPGIYDLLDRLAERNIPLAILSNKLHEITIQIVSILFNKFKFTAVFGSRAGIPKKPDPHSALEIAKIMSLNSREILFVGDSEADMKTALACNMRPIGVSWGYRSVNDIRNAGAATIINKPLELLNYL